MKHICQRFIIFTPKRVWTISRPEIWYACLPRLIDRRPWVNRPSSQRRSSRDNYYLLPSGTRSRRTHITISYYKWNMERERVRARNTPAAVSQAKCVRDEIHTHTHTHTRREVSRSLYFASCAAYTVTMYILFLYNIIIIIIRLISTYARICRRHAEKTRHIVFVAGPVR